MAYTVTHRAQQHPAQTAEEAMKLADQLAAQANGLVIVTYPSGRSVSVRDFRTSLAEGGQS